MMRIFNLLKHPLFSGSAIMIIGSTAVSFLNYLYHLILGRMLGPANYGELAAVISLIVILGIIPGSLNMVIIKYISIAKDEKEVSSLIHWFKTKILFASFLFSLLILILSPILSSFLKIDQGYYLMLVAVSFFFSTQALLNRSILQGLLRFKEMIIALLVENGFKLLLSIVLIYLGFQVGGAVLAFVISIIIGWYITNIFISYQSKQELDKNIEIKKMLLFSLPVLIQAISITSIYSSDLILVKHFFSPHDAGIYAALSTLGKIIFFGTGPIGSVMFPLVSKRSSKGQQYRRIFLYSFLATLFLSVCVIVGYFLFPGIAIKLLYGSAYLEASGLLVWFGIFISLFTLSSLLVNYCLSLGQTKVVVFPLSASIMQIFLILFFHQTLYEVIIVSLIISSLLLGSLLIYSSYGKRRFI